MHNIFVPTTYLLKGKHAFALSSKHTWCQMPQQSLPADKTAASGAARDKNTSAPRPHHQLRVFHPHLHHHSAGVPCRCHWLRAFWQRMQTRASAGPPIPGRPGRRCRGAAGTGLGRRGCLGPALLQCSHRAGEAVVEVAAQQTHVSHTHDVQ